MSHMIICIHSIVTIATVDGVQAMERKIGNSQKH